MGIIRLLLAFAVFNSHYPVAELPIVDGHEAVMAFFAISGFYMALILDTKYLSKSDFYLSRFLTLYPMYVFAVIISVGLLVVADIHPLTSQDKVNSILSNPAGFLAMAWTSLCIIGQEFLFSIGQAADGTLHLITASRHGIYKSAPLVQTWSLSIELMFYALAPTLVFLRTRTLLALIGISVALRGGIMVSPLSDISFFWRFFPAEFWLFGCGILAYRFSMALPKRQRAEDVFAIILLAGLILTAGDVDDWLEPFMLPLGTLATMPFIFRLSRHWNFDRFIGKTSYPFYLLHFSAIAIFERYQEEPTGWHILLAAYAAAVLTHLLFNPGLEAMKEKLRTRRDRRDMPVGSRSPLTAPALPTITATNHPE